MLYQPKGCVVSRLRVPSPFAQGRRNFGMLCPCGFRFSGGSVLRLFWLAWRLPDGSGYLSDFRMVIFRRFPHADVPLPVGLYRGFCRFSYCDVPASPVWLYCDLCRFSYCDVPAFRRVVFCFFRQRTVPFVRAALFAGVCPVFLLLKGWMRLCFLFLRAVAPFFCF